MTKLSKKEEEVLEAIYNGGQGDEYAQIYKGLEIKTKMDRAEIKTIITELRKLGLVEYIRGLMTEDGKVAGSGFLMTREGMGYMYDLESTPIRLPH